MKTILIIDDEDSIRQLLKECLTKWGYHVQLAKDGWEGIRRINDERKYDAILTDIGMPELDGNDVAIHIRSSEKSHTPIIAITGLRNSSLQSALFDLVIQKPFNLIMLKSSLESLIPKKI
jgi:CheY-like chemotaxis protein